MPAEKKKTVRKRVTKVKNAGPGIGGGVNALFGYPANQGTGWSKEISQTTTEYLNLRWYFISNQRNLLSQMYVELGLVQTLCNVPVRDALRGGVMIKSQQLDEQQLDELSGSVDRNNDLNVIAQTAIWDRLFGGSATIVITGQPPETPLVIENITPDEPLEFRAVDLWELFWDMQAAQGFDPTDQQADIEFYSYYGVKIHKSRVMKMTGIEAPSYLRPRLRGWGMSACEALVRSLNQYLKATDLTFELLDEFKLDIYKIKNLVNSLMTQGKDSVYNRIADANLTKNYQNAIVMDSEDDYVQKQLSFAGLADTMGQIRMQVASDLRMPMIKLFGQQAGGGLGNSGEDEIEVYNSMVESEVRDKIKYHIIKVLKIKCQKLFGFVPDDITIEFAPLRVLSGEQEENVKTQKFTRLLSAFTAGAISLDTFQEGCNKSKVFDITVEVGGEGATGVDMGEDDGATESSVDEAADATGPNRADSQRAQAVPVSKKNAIPIRKRIGKYLRNSDGFDKASYEADGGDTWTDDRRKYFYECASDASLYRECAAESRRIYGKDNWKFTVWLYQKRGGKFDIGGVA